MKNKFPLVSVVMLNYNGIKYLKRTIKPLLDQDYPNLEFILVDNGSTDGSLDYIKKFKKIKLIKNRENLGYSKGKNIGVNVANGKYIFMVDNDILVNQKDFLSSLVKEYGKNIGFLQVLLEDWGKTNTKYYGIFFSLYGANLHQASIKTKKIINWPKDIPIAASTGGCFLISKVNWRKIGGFDESQLFNLDDFDIGSRAWIYGFKNYLYTKTSLKHLGVGKTSLSKDYASRFKFLFSGHARSMMKNYGTKNLLWGFPLLFAFQFLKAIRYSFKKKSLRVFGAFILSTGIFLKNFIDTLRQRKIVQSTRVIKEDIFLKIKPPKFYK